MSISPVTEWLASGKPSYRVVGINSIYGVRAVRAY